MKQLLRITLIFIITASCLQVQNNKHLEVKKQQLSNYSAIIRTVHGNIRFKFYESISPNTTKQIIKLINKGFYDGLAFHRVIPGIILQTGKDISQKLPNDFSGLKAEISELKHKKGTVSMARYKNNLDSANSQFFISLKDLPDLDGKYTIFAKVIEGFDVLDKISKGDLILSITISNHKVIN